MSQKATEYYETWGATVQTEFEVPSQHGVVSIEGKKLIRKWLRNQGTVIRTNLLLHRTGGGGGGLYSEGLRGHGENKIENFHVRTR